jgi:RNA-splicing ligase RtcB
MENPRWPIRVESQAMAAFADSAPCGLLRDGENCNLRQSRFNLDPDKVKNGLAQLVLTLVKLLHELLERQAIRRIEAGSLTDAQVDRLGLALMRQAEVLEQLRQDFGLEEADLNLDLGPLGRLL